MNPRLLRGEKRAQRSGTHRGAAIDYADSAAARVTRLNGIPQIRLTDLIDILFVTQSMEAPITVVLNWKPPPDH
jgi:hypothetical protein